MQDNDALIILGIDPGTQVTGYGLIRLSEKKMEVLDYGCIRPPHKSSLSDRYLIIFDGIETIIEKFKPHELAIETQFVHKNAQSALKLGMAKGSAIIAAKRKQLRIYEYAPKVVKRSVSGQGQASKPQVQYMVQHLLKLKTMPQPSDAADALAIAICHAQIAPYLKEKNAI